MSPEFDTISTEPRAESSGQIAPVVNESIDPYEADRVEALSQGFNLNLLLAMGIGGITDEIARRIVAQVENLKIAVFKGTHGDFYVKDSDINPTVITKVTAAVLPPRESNASFSSVTRRRTK